MTLGNFAAAGPAPSAVLVGMMATGKSSVGRCLAARMNCQLLDSDDWVEKTTGRTVRQIFESEGEEAFRALESQALAEALVTPGPVVVAAAGGTVLSPGNRRRLVEHDSVVWLRASVATIVGRLIDDTDSGHRPLLGDDVTKTVPDLVAARTPFYAEVADIVIDVDNLSHDEVCARVAAALSLHPRAGSPPAPAA